MASSTLNLIPPGRDELHSGSVRTLPVHVADGTYVRGEVLGLSGNTYGKLAAAADAAAIMPFAVTLAEPATISVYVAGDFNENAIELNGMPLADVKTALRKLDINARAWGAAPNGA